MKRKDTQKIALTGILIAVIAVMTFVPFLGLIYIVGLPVTTIFLPVIIGIIVLKDWRYSLILGFAFGFFTFLKAWIAPGSPFDQFFINPLISIVPRVLMAGIGHLVYLAVSHLRWKSVVSAITALSVALSNSFLVLGTLLLLEFNKFDVLAKEFEFRGAVNYVLITLGSNSLIEAVLAIVVTVIVVKATDVYISRFHHDHA